jgi:hypothetical protein
MRLYQKDLYGLLIKTAADSIIKLAADPHYVGGQVGVMAVLHTWGSNLSYHLHVHCLVTGGGLSSDGYTWISVETLTRATSSEISALEMNSCNSNLPASGKPHLKAKVGEHRDQLYC